MGTDVYRTSRGTWHVIDRDNGAQWEAADSAEVESSIAAFQQHLADEKAAAEAAANAPAEVSEVAGEQPGTNADTVARGN